MSLRRRSGAAKREPDQPTAAGPVSPARPASARATARPDSATAAPLLRAQPAMRSGKKGAENSLALDANFAVGRTPDAQRGTRTVPTPGQGNHGPVSPTR